MCSARESAVGRLGVAKGSVPCSLCDNDRERRVGQGKTSAPLTAGLIYSALSLDSPMLSCPDLYFTGEGRRHREARERDTAGKCWI